MPGGRARDHHPGAVRRAPDGARRRRGGAGPRRAPQHRLPAHGDARAPRPARARRGRGRLPPGPGPGAAGGIRAEQVSRARAGRPAAARASRRDRRDRLARRPRRAQDHVPRPGVQPPRHGERRLGRGPPGADGGRHRQAAPRLPAGRRDRPARGRGSAGAPGLSETELAPVRRQGHAVRVGEAEDGYRGVAVPIRDEAARWWRRSPSAGRGSGSPRGGCATSCCRRRSRPLRACPRRWDTGPLDGHPGTRVLRGCGAVGLSFGVLAVAVPLHVAAMHRPASLAGQLLASVTVAVAWPRSAPVSSAGWWAAPATCW